MYLRSVGRQVSGGLGRGGLGSALCGLSYPSSAAQPYLHSRSRGLRESKNTQSLLRPRLGPGTLSLVSRSISHSK